MLILHFYSACKILLRPFKLVNKFSLLTSVMEISLKEKVDLSGMRVPYEPDDVKKDFSMKNPMKLFESWFETARKTDGIREANAMAIASSDKSGKPSVRYVLLKGYGADGFTFFTNYDSRKGREILENPQVALLFYWEPLCRQIRIEGTVSKSTQKESEEYFHSRPRCSQISALVSQQSEIIESKDVLIKKKLQLEGCYLDESVIIPKPSNWGGFTVQPMSFEFWCGRSNRLHDRMRFRRPNECEVPDEILTHAADEGWIYEFLSP